MQQYVTAGANPMSVKKGIDKTCDFLIGKLKEHAKPVKGRLDIKVNGGTLWGGEAAACLGPSSKGLPRGT